MSNPPMKHGRRPARFQSESTAAPSSELVERAVQPKTTSPTRNTAGGYDPVGYAMPASPVLRSFDAGSSVPPPPAAPASTNPVHRRGRTQAQHYAAEQALPVQRAAVPPVRPSVPPAVQQRAETTLNIPHMSSRQERLRMQDAPPPVMQRPPRPNPSAYRKEQKERPAFPKWLTIALVLVFFTGAALFAGEQLMRAWLKQQADAKAAAHQAIVDAHPIYYQDLIEKYADENNLEPAFVEAIILNESSFRPTAESSIGARGLMQLMEATAEWVAGKLKVEHYSFDMMWDPETNIRFGTWYLNYLSKLFRGDPVLVSCAFHAGQGTVNNWLSNPAISIDGVTIALSALPEGPTKVYAGRVTEAYDIYQALYYHQETPGPDDEPDPAALGMQPV